MTGTNETYRYDAFISYSHHDKDWVQGWLLPQLEAASLRVCIDFRDFEPGLPSLVNMENAVERSRKTLIVLTPAWVASEWAAFESLLTQTDDPAGRRACMIPLRLKACKPPKRIAMLTYVDFARAEQREFQLARLIAAIRSEPTTAKSTLPSLPLTAPEPSSRSNITIVGDGNVVGNGSSSIVVKAREPIPGAPVSWRLPLSADASITTVRKYIVARYNLEELRTLCQDLGVDYDNLYGGDKTSKAHELVTYCQRHGLWEELLASLRTL